MPFWQKIKDRARGGHFWQVAGAVTAIVAIFVAAAQMIQAANIQNDSAELARRTLIAELSFEAHSAAFELLSAVAQHYVEPSSSLNEAGSCNAPQKLPREIHAAAIKLDGAVSRAHVIDDEPINQCLSDISEFFQTISEHNIPCQTSVETMDVASSLQMFPEYVSRYVNRKDIPQDQNPILDDSENPTCPFMFFILGRKENQKILTSKLSAVRADVRAISEVYVGKLAIGAGVAYHCGWTNEGDAGRILNKALKNAKVKNSILEFANRTFAGQKNHVCPIGDIQLGHMAFWKALKKIAKE